MSIFFFFLPLLDDTLLWCFSIISVLLPYFRFRFQSHVFALLVFFCTPTTTSVLRQGAVCVVGAAGVCSGVAEALRPPPLGKGPYPCSTLASMCAGTSCESVSSHTSLVFRGIHQLAITSFRIFPPFFQRDTRVGWGREGGYTSNMRRTPGCKC